MTFQNSVSCGNLCLSLYLIILSSLNIDMGCDLTENLILNSFSPNTTQHHLGKIMWNMDVAMLLHI